MKKNMISAPCAYVLTWFALVGAVFAYSMGGCWDYLLTSGPRSPAQATYDAKRPSVADPASQPRLEDLLPPARLGTQSLSPDTALALSPGRDRPKREIDKTVKAVVSGPRFDTSSADFTAHFDLSIPVMQSHASWQPDPAAWMVDIPGQWKRQGREEYHIRHGLIRKARIMIYKDKLRLKFYFTERKRKPGPLPVVDFSHDGIDVSIIAPSR